MDDSNKGHSPPQMSTPPLSVLACRLLLVQDELYALANEGQGVLENGDFVISGHVLTRQFELFLHS